MAYGSSDHLICLAGHGRSHCHTFYNQSYVLSSVGVCQEDVGKKIKNCCALQSLMTRYISKFDLRQMLAVSRVFSLFRICLYIGDSFCCIVIVCYQTLCADFKEQRYRLVLLG